MPRIEYTPVDFDESEEDEGSPTFDCCKSCAAHFEEGEPMPEFTQPGIGEAITGSTDVAHPDYEDGECWCGVCDEVLTSDDN